MSGGECLNFVYKVFYQVVGDGIDLIVVVVVLWIVVFNDKVYC